VQVWRERFAQVGAGAVQWLLSVLVYPAVAWPSCPAAPETTRPRPLGSGCEPDTTVSRQGVPPPRRRKRW